MNTQILNRETIAPRKATWQQIEVKGEHPAMQGTRRVVQVIDDEAIAKMDADFRERAADPYFDGVLVDADHLKYDLSEKTEAYAWLMNTEVREGELYGLLEWTDLGAGAVLNRRYKYFSTEYDAADLEDLGSGKVRPTRLAGLTLTNMPNNKGGKKITNRKAADAEHTQTKTKTMNKIIETLGLPAEATEEQIVSAIGSILNRAKRADELETETEVEAILNRNEKRIPEGQRDAWKSELIKNREGAEKLILTLPERTESDHEQKPAITNRSTATVPDVTRCNGEADDATAAKQKAEAMRIQNRDQCSFVRAWDMAKIEKPELFN